MSKHFVVPEVDMSVLVLIGRVLFVAVFLNAVFPHLAKTSMMAGYAKSKGVPLPWAATFVGGILLLLGGISVLFGIWADLGALLLAVFLLPTAVLIHGFWRETGENRMTEQIQFFKDLGLAGACLTLAGLFAIAGHDLGLTLTGPLFNVR
jgi:putative oxidoreductase